MPILLYCVTEADAAAALSSIGVADLPVFRWAFPQFDLFASRAPDPSAWLKRELRSSAVEFHRVLRHLFEAGVIVPFRFPTIFESDETVHRHMREHSDKYIGLLEKFRDNVQMEIGIKSVALGRQAASGAEYLKIRQQAMKLAEGFAAELKQKLTPILQEWRQRNTRNELRAFVLIGRNQTTKFHSLVSSMTVPQELRARATGPWPVSEFIEQGPM